LELVIIIPQRQPFSIVRILLASFGQVLYIRASPEMAIKLYQALI